jgi:uncharacterized protein with HEPN domain
MELEIKKFLFDIHESIDSIEKYLGEQRDFKVYMANKMLRRAVEREFEIIGEAMNRIEKDRFVVEHFEQEANHQYAKPCDSWV